MMFGLCGDVLAYFLHMALADAECAIAVLPVERNERAILLADPLGTIGLDQTDYFGQRDRFGLDIEDMDMVGRTPDDDGGTMVGLQDLRDVGMHLGEMLLG